MHTAWLLFGAIAVPVVNEQADWRTVGYAAVLSVTVFRMLSVALSQLGTRSQKTTLSPKRFGYCHIRT